MKKKQIISITTSLVIALVFSIGLSYVSAAWTNPSLPPVGGNIDAPVHKGSGSQSKLGDLSVERFTALANAGFAQDIFFRGSVNGIANLGSTTPTLKIGGINKLGTSYGVKATVNGDVQSTQTVGSSELVNSTLKTLCGDDEGHVVFCGATIVPPPPSVAFSSGGVVASPVMGGTADTNIYCEAAFSNSSVTGDTVVFRYTYNYPASSGQSMQDSCTVYVSSGQNTGTTYPGQEYFPPTGTNVNVIDYCFDATQSTVQNISNIPSC